MLKHILTISIIVPALVLAAVMPEHKMSTIVPGKRGTVLLFVSSMCPCTDQHKAEVKQLMSVTQTRGISYYCVFSNITENDSRIGQFYRNIGWDMPYIHDGDGHLAKKFGASRTPQVVMLDSSGNPVYRGPIDDSNKNLGRIEHPYLRDNVNALLEGEALAFTEIPAIGCWLVTTSDLPK